MADLDLSDDARRRRIRAPGLQPGAPPNTPGPTAPTGAGNLYEPPSMPMPRIMAPDEQAALFRGLGDPNWRPGQMPRTPTSSSADDIRKALEGVSRGLQVTDDDVRDVQRLNMGDTTQSRLSEFAAQYERRAAPTEGRSSDSQGPGFNQQTNQATPSFQVRNTNQFRDPVTGPVADLASQLSSRFLNPPAGSGNQLLEQALRNLSAQFQQGGFTPAENEVLQTQALDPLERLRTARKQQLLQQLSQRGIRVNPAAPEGVAKQALDDVDRQFDALRASQQTQLGAQAANERRQRMLQSLDMLSGLASNEQSRLGTGYQYATVPVGLADRAFNQSMQLYGQANPAALINPAMQMAQLGQGQNANFGAALAQLAWLLMQGQN